MDERQYVVTVEHTVTFDIHLAADNRPHAEETAKMVAEDNLAMTWLDEPFVADEAVTVVSHVWEYLPETRSEHA